MARGKAFNMGGRERVLAPLMLRDYYDFKESGEMEVLQKPAGRSDEEYLPAAEHVLVSQFRKNHEDFTAEEYQANVSLADVPRLVAELFRMSGMDLGPLGPAPGEESPSGEATS